MAIESGRPSPEENIVEVEQELPRRPVVDLFQMSEEELLRFAERVDVSNGIARIFVHPAFGLLYDMAGEVSDEEVEKYRKFSSLTFEKMCQMLQMEAEKTPPMILLEEERMAESMSQVFARANEVSQNELYMVVTNNQYSTPKILDSKVNDGQTVLGESQSWLIFSRLLEALGVKKIILAGGAVKYRPLSGEEFDAFRDQINLAMSEFHNQRQEKGAKNTAYTPSHCLGMAMLYLSKSFEVDISNFSFPDTPADLRKIEQNG